MRWRRTAVLAGCTESGRRGLRTRRHGRSRGPAGLKLEEDHGGDDQGGAQHLRPRQPFTQDHAGQGNRDHRLNGCRNGGDGRFEVAQADSVQPITQRRGDQGQERQPQDGARLTKCVAKFFSRLQRRQKECAGGEGV